MSIFDKITGRAKKAAGDLAGDPHLRDEGSREEHKGEKQEELAEAKRETERKEQEAREAERRT